MNPNNFFIFSYNPKSGIIIGIAIAMLLFKSV